MCIRPVVIVLSFFAACACGAHAQPNKVADTGIHGTVMVSPTRPGPTKKGFESENAAPLPNATFSVTGDDGAVKTFTTDSNGRFQISLRPGRYVVLLAENRFPKPCGPFEVSVEEGKMTNVEWRCDSGMR